jgi:membrane associated rhomboid family serine protease
MSAILTGSPIEIHPQFNPMIGPSFYVLVNMGARFQPCMRNLDDVAVQWPCPNLTSLTPNTPGNTICSLEEFCGFGKLSDPPNQWYRFIVPIFLHAGIIHLGFNMLLQLTLGREMEQVIGSVRFLFVYFSSGIFGFVLGGNFAAKGLASSGASGSLFGLIAINLLDLLYTWNERVSPKKELAFIILDIAVSFVLGLLPGLDNFSHIGGFLMGLVLGVCLLHSPNLLRGERIRSRPASVGENPANKKKTRRATRVSYKIFLKDPIGFFKDRKLLWWTWWLVRAAALISVLAAFIVLLKNFYDPNPHNCTWCRYLTCIVSIS